ncbi:MAG: hypothetical protein F6K42_18080 [Leptolyngbya sp. SIO1D8]|nr:hypothetical protein [Leptolyngbya sp. SIO1D8]
MPKKINDLIRQRIKKDLATKNGTKEEIADRHGVSIGTVKRLAKEVKPITSAADHVAGAIASGALGLATTESLDYGVILNEIITELRNSLKDAKPGSREGVAGRLMDALKAHREFMTMEQAVDWVLGLPNFDAEEFTRLLKEKYADKRAAG